VLLLWLAGCLAAVSFLLQLWQFVVAFLFPLHRRRALPGPDAGVTLLKPLKGCDASTRESLRSWLDQDYQAPRQILFGVQDSGDPVCQLVQELLTEFPAANARLIICPGRNVANPKVSLLRQLLPHAAHEVIVLSDADVRAPRDLLTNLVAPLADRSVGMTNCLYRLANPTTAAMRWEAVSTNVDFWSQVLQARSLWRQDFGLGAAMALRADRLAAVGGFEPLGDFLADDFHLGRQVAQSGGRIELCPVVVECLEAPRYWRATWDHQIRWARTIRRCQPLGYGCSILANLTLGALLFGAALSGPPGWAMAAGLIAIRMILGVLLQRRLGDPPRDWLWCWMIPVKDLLAVLVWIAAFAGDTVVWRGTRYRVLREGKLIAL
jgi:ceramide glucosyltransferase